MLEPVSNGNLCACLECWRKISFVLLGGLFRKFGLKLFGLLLLVELLFMLWFIIMGIDREEVKSGKEVYIKSKMGMLFFYIISFFSSQALV